MEFAYIKNQNIQSYLCMINDAWRNKFFRDALNKHAKNKVVLDMGTGTGILAFYALSAGAKFVYCIESNSKMSEIADKILSKNFDKSRFTVINCNFWSDEIDGKINDKIDILVSETVGPGLFDQGMFHTWHCIKPFLADGAISIPDRLHLDIWIWNDNQDLNFHKKPFHYTKSLDKDFANCLIQVDQELSHPTPSVMNWVQINRIKNPPLKEYQDILSYTMHHLPELEFTSEKYPRHIIPGVSFDLDIDSPCKVGFIGKISFEDETLFLKDAAYMPWKNNPVIDIDKSGRYTFTYNNLGLDHKCPDEWSFKIIEEQ